MTARRSQMPPEEGEEPQDWTRVLSFGGLAGAVLGVLLLGAAMRTDSPRTAPVLPAPSTSAGLLVPRDPAPEPPAEAATAPTPAPADDLAARAAADLERLAARPEGWTAQLAVLCDVERVASLTRRFGDRDGFYLLPVLHGDDACFRMCWSRYDSRQDAASASDMPRAMREIEARPLPKAIAEVVE